LDTPGYHPEDKNFKYFQDITGKELAGFFGSPNMRHQGGVRGCAFSPDGKTFVSASEDGTLKLWDAASGQCIKTLQLPWTPLYVTFSPQNPNLAVTANRNGTLTLFDFSQYM